MGVKKVAIPCGSVNQMTLTPLILLFIERLTKSKPLGCSTTKLLADFFQCLFGRFRVFLFEVEITGSPSLQCEIRLPGEPESTEGVSFFIEPDCLVLLGKIRNALSGLVQIFDIRQVDAIGYT